MEAQFDESVLFIGGAFGDFSVSEEGTITLKRTIVLPNEGSATVFLPLLNGQFDNLVDDPEDPNNLTGNLTAGELQAALSELFDLTSEGGWVSDLFASVDGMPVINPEDYRQVSEAPFSYTAPYPTANGLLNIGGFTDETYLDNAGEDPIQLKDLAVGKKVTITPAVADGYWMAVKIPGGSHTLNFGGTLSIGGDPVFSLDITYNILHPLYGKNGKDMLTGTPNNDYIDGGNGKDYLFGDDGDDLLVGGKGKDVVDGGQGDDELWGGSGKDKFIFKSGYDEDSIFDFAPGEIVETSGPPVAATDVTLPSGVGAAQIDFGSGDILTFVGLQSTDLALQDGVISFA